MIESRENIKMKVLKIISTKEIACYSCKRCSGMSSQKLIRQTILDKKTKRKIKELKKLIWEARGFKRIGFKLWLCRKCEERRCKRCDILLNNKRICVCDACEAKHGAFYEIDLNYCKKCFDIRKKGRN